MLESNYGRFVKYLFGKHLCPMMNMQMAKSSNKKKSKKFATKKGISRLEKNNWRRRSPGAPRYNRPTTSQEKRRWAGKQGTVERFEYFLNKSASRKLRGNNKKIRPQTVNNNVITTPPIRGRQNRPSTVGNSGMVVHRTSNNRLLRQPSRPPVNIHVRHRKRSSLLSSPRSMRAAKLHHVFHAHQEDNDDFITDYLLRRQCVQYIMPRHVESMHLRDDLDHDEEHDEVGVKDDDGGLNFRSGNNNINVDEW